MAIPELVVMEGVRRAWQFLKERSFVIGLVAKEFSLIEQEQYRSLLEKDNPTFTFQNPTGRTRLPIFAVSLISENESPEGQYLGDDGGHNFIVPYPPEQPEDFELYRDINRFTYPSQEAPRALSPGGNIDERSTANVRNNPLPRRNLGVQREPGDEQYSEMGHPARLYHEGAQGLEVRVIGSQVQMGITVVCNTSEKTVIYTRLMLHVLRAWSKWFNVNGLYNSVFSAADLAQDETLAPTTDGNPPFRRQITMNFLFQDFNLEVVKVLTAWMLTVDMATPAQGGGLDLTRVATVEGDFGIVNPLK